MVRKGLWKCSVAMESAVKSLLLLAPLSAATIRTLSCKNLLAKVFIPISTTGACKFHSDYYCYYPFFSEISFMITLGNLTERFDDQVIFAITMVSGQWDHVASFAQQHAASGQTNTCSKDALQNSWFAFSSEFHKPVVLSFKLCDQKSIDVVQFAWFQSRCSSSMVDPNTWVIGHVEVVLHNTAEYSKHFDEGDERSGMRYVVLCHIYSIMSNCFPLHSTFWQSVGCGTSKLSPIGRSVIMFKETGTTGCRHAMTGPFYLPGE